MVAQFACKVIKLILFLMEVDESIDILGSPAKRVHCTAQEGRCLVNRPRQIVLANHEKLFFLKPKSCYFNTSIFHTNIIKYHRSLFFLDNWNLRKFTLLAEAFPLCFSALYCHSLRGFGCSRFVLVVSVPRKRPLQTAVWDSC